MDARIGISPPIARRTAPVIGYIAAAVALVLVGAYLAVGVITRGAPADPVIALPPGPFGTSQDIPASFGVVAVEHVEKINGLGAKALAGATHGISGYVAPNKVQVQASVTLTNLLDHPIAYDPRQFRLLVGEKRKPLDEVQSNLRPGTLQPDASIDSQLKFIVPRDGSKLWIEFTDPGRAKPILVDLGRTGKTPPGAFDGFHRGHK
ncbi:MAG TPA: hypothetical protein VMY78_06520 [Solirubrobacteraceae bacterium]|nr:hypothetical protein [Solirubrobacteraceae bacterium]